MAQIHKYASHSPDNPNRIVVFNPTLRSVLVTSEGHRLHPREWAEVCPDDPAVQQALQKDLTFKRTVHVSTRPEVPTETPKPKRGRKSAASNIAQKGALNNVETE